jgi:hypothetical protein
MSDSKVVVKPPMGVIPENIWKSLRETELTQAIRRYLVAELYVPKEWDSEIAKLLAEKEASVLRVYLYQSWDGEYYLTNMYDGITGLKMYICGDTTTEEIATITGVGVSLEIYKMVTGQESTIELYDFGVTLE